jgi:probable O-glycosylation ligase (exosortase A-associated)
VLRSLFLLFIYASFVGLTVNAPFVATLGYVWVDTFQPQQIAYIILNQIPVAMILGLAAFGGYLLVDRRDPPPVTRETILQLTMAVWVTCTTLWAQVPDAAWAKWDWAFKTLVFAAFIPYSIRSRVQIEAFAQTYVFSLAANFIPFGLKTLISGGGYGVNLGLEGGNTGLSEGGLLSTVCLMAVPLAMHLAQHSQLLPRWKILPLAYWATAGLAIATAVGTFERSALLGLVVLGGYMWLRSKNKLLLGAAIAAVGAVIIYSTASSYANRMSTIGTYQSDASAYTRILVWKWTLNFIASHPFGGGFQTYLINSVELPATGGTPAHVEFGRAFHSSYFEVLGEHGYVGMAIFLTIAISMFLRLNRIAKRARPHPELQWVVSMSNALQSGFAVFMSSGAFVGIAFQPIFWYFVAMGVSLHAYLYRVENMDAPAPVTGWRAMAAKASAAPGALAPATDWRNRPAPAPLSALRPQR